MLQTILSVILLLASLTVGAEENRGFTQGKALANQEKTRPLTNGVPINTLLPGYDAALNKYPAYQGNMNLNTASTARLADCRANPNQNGDFAAAQECTALNYLTNDAARAADLRIYCQKYTSQTDPSKVPLECKQASVPSMNGAVSHGNPFLANAENDPAVQKFGSTDVAGIIQSNQIDTGRFTGCTSDSVVVSAAVYQVKTCDVQDDVRHVACSWNPADGQSAGCGHLDRNPACEARVSGELVEPPSCTAWARAPHIEPNLQPAC